VYNERVGPSGKTFLIQTLTQFLNSYGNIYEIKEREVIVAIHEMAIPSLDPDSFERLKIILNELCKARNIPFER
jgi:hypothetical protein